MSKRLRIFLGILATCYFTACFGAMIWLMKTDSDIAFSVFIGLAMLGFFSLAIGGAWEIFFKGSAEK